jgi:hypothetical protein
MLLLDAMEDAPTLYLVLTAREHLTRAQCTVQLRHLRRVLRAQWPNVRWAVLVEFQRRGALHLNLLVKGVPVLELEALHELVAGTWCSRVDAAKAAQWSGVIADELGVVKYVTLHFMKQAQAPAVGWKGHRYSSTRDYLVRPASVLRQEARQSLRLKRLLHRGLDLEEAELELAAGNAVTWELKTVGKLSRDPDRARDEAARMPFRTRRGRAGAEPDAALTVLPVPPRRVKRACASADVNPAQSATSSRHRPRAPGVSLATGRLGSAL